MGTDALASRPSLTIRWNIGDVSSFGFESLRLSIWGLFRRFGAEARYVVCVNSVDLDRARDRTGPVPEEIEWIRVDGELPEWLKERFLDERLADGVAWKFAPLQLSPDRYELSLDNDLVLWDLPQALSAWMREPAPGSCCLAEDVRLGFGRFSDLCGELPRNTGIRGLPPGFGLEGALRRVLEERPGRLRSELDEQGLQVAALSCYPLKIVPTQDVTICSPWPMHQQHLGSKGAHFVGLNAKFFPEEWGGAAARRLHEDHFRRWREVLYQRIGVRPHPDTCE